MSAQRRMKFISLNSFRKCLRIWRRHFKTLSIYDGWVTNLPSWWCHHKLACFLVSNTGPIRTHKIRHSFYSNKKKKGNWNGYFYRFVVRKMENWWNFLRKSSKAGDKFVMLNVFRYFLAKGKYWNWKFVILPFMLVPIVI